MLLENIEGCDVIFKVGDEKFHAHKLVLAARSPIFRSQFYQQERDHDDIIIIDMEPKVFEVITLSLLTLFSGFNNLICHTNNES